ncbi:LysR family transcriptional regulator [Breoghania corrubedonensis]|uniref:LysR family transcriptional regulator n=1 Tax=Breoghania corrubedonensis TaxID=665038 RepID=A0A2T5VHC6_9HYPH|nr:LysR family transcriptional regulator [Breoghania corrubedonensis]PTW63144.1 LysR family transcriptional regulator [Breoghania corrubedonensis]
MTKLSLRSGVFSQAPGSIHQLCILSTFGSAHPMLSGRSHAVLVGGQEHADSEVRHSVGPTVMEVRQLNYVIAAADNESFRRAAEALHVRQSSVSRAIRQLEDELGVSLFERRSTGAHLTDAGRSLLAEVRPALEQLGLARKSAAAAGRAEIGVVRVGILTSLSGGFLRELIRSYAARHPSIVVDIRDGGRDEHLSAIRRRALDVAFVTGDRQVADCETSTLWEERVHVALPTEHHLARMRQLDWPDLRNERFIVSRFAPGPEVHDYIIRRAADYSTYPNIHYRTAHLGTLLNLVGLGQGITLVSAALTQVQMPSLVLRPLTDVADIVPFSAVWSRHNDNPALRRFVSVAHTLAGRVRRGASDWSHEAMGIMPSKCEAHLGRKKHGSSSPGRAG